MAPANESAREEARLFLEGLRDYFNAKWHADEVKQKMLDYEDEAKSKNPKLRNMQRETIFSNNFVVPAIHGYLQRHASAPLSEGDACKALLAEGYANFTKMASASPMSDFEHPFAKQFNTVRNIAESWWNSSNESAVRKACPDFALRLPYKVVGETKYFRERGIEAAKTELVKGIYQCFFYRGLPWDYEYACFLAYDASGKGSLAKAWGEKGVAKVREACWEGANIFVMILPS
jgi:hypothetical protein